MPLLRRTPFPLVEPPEDVKPQDLVYQVRFTKEIFCNYHDYLNRMNLYRQRMWTCKMTGKGNLTYEEALLSENRATDKVKEFPKEIMKPVLKMIQFSMLPLKVLVSMINKKVREGFLEEGVELQARKGDGVYLCKILKVLENSATQAQYEVAWLDEDQKSSGTDLVSEQDLLQKKLPLSREVLQSFIRESTYRNVPWVLHNDLARKHGISSDPPKELMGKVSLQGGLIVTSKKRNKVEEDETLAEIGRNKRKKLDEDDLLNKEPIQYPTEDQLVQPSFDDPKFPERPSPLKDFNVPMDCFGDLLMVWDFCSSFRRLLQLSPFSLRDFEKAISHKESNLVLIVETHGALFRLLMKDKCECFSASTQQRKRKITLVTWTEYLCDFIEMIENSELRACLTTIRRGHYGLLDTSVKVRIFRELVDRAIETDILKEELDEYVKQQREIGAARREEAIEEAKKKREENENMKLESGVNHVSDKQNVESTGKKVKITANGDHGTENGFGDDKRNGVISSPQKLECQNSCRKDVKSSSKKSDNKQKIDISPAAKTENDGTPPMRNKDQRKEHFERELEKRRIRTKPLGKDREYNRYWWFKGDGRIFIESFDSKEWSYYNTKEELDTFMDSLNLKGLRERSLHGQLTSCYGRISSDLQKKLKEINQEIANEEAVVRRSTRVRAQPRERPAFIKYVNKWKED